MLMADSQRGGLKMRNENKWIRWGGIIVITTVLLLGAGIQELDRGYSEEAGSGFIPEGTIIVLSDDFMRNLQDAQQRNVIDYGKSREEQLLSHLALLGRYLVETNLMLVKQQNRIIELLEKQEKKK